MVEGPFPRVQTRIREATPDDAEALHRLYHAAYSVHSDPARLAIGGLRDTIDDVRAYIRDSTVLVAENEEGELVATCATRRIANLRRLAVAPGAKGAGLGAKLLEAAVQRAVDDGFEVAQLETIRDHPWLSSFYERHGFEVRGVESMPNGLDWLVMRRKLS